MRFASAVSDIESSPAAVRRAVAEVREALDDKADVAFVFFTGHHLDDAAAIAEEVWLELDPQAVVGCSAEGVLGADRGGERAPGIAILAGARPGGRGQAVPAAARGGPGARGAAAAVAAGSGEGA